MWRSVWRADVDDRRGIFVSEFVAFLIDIPFLGALFVLFEQYHVFSKFTLVCGLCCAHFQRFCRG